MQKIQSYLYPNRIILLADLAGFNVENRVVYSRTVKIYNGIDNTIQFDIQNADQKRLDLTTFSIIEMNVMDSQGNSLPNSPYAITPTIVPGVGSTKIPQGDLVDLDSQYLRFSVTAVKDGEDVLLYCDTQFSAVGNLELAGSAMPTFRNEKVYDRFSGEIDFAGNVKNHTSAIPCKFYEAVPTSELTFIISMTNYIGKIYIEGTRDSTISVESFRNSEIPNTRHEYTIANNIPYTITVPTGDYNYLRVVWTYLDPVLIGVNNVYPSGTVDKVVVS
jgi:hypothetical protein